MPSNVVIKAEAVVDGEWKQDGPPISKAEFLAINEDLDPVYKAQAARMAVGDVLVWNMGAGGVVRLTAIENRGDRFVWQDGDLTLVD